MESGEYRNDDLLKKYDESVRPVVYLEDLKKAILCSIGHDDRTVKKWLFTFRRAKIIKEVGTGLFEFSPFYDDLIKQKQQAQQDSVVAVAGGLEHIGGDS